WDTVLNDWGKSNEGLFSGAIAGATYLVEHMDTLVRILKAVAIGYGSVKAAIVLNSVATKGYTGIAVIDNTVRSAKLVLMKAEAALNGTALAQKKAMTAAENAHFTALEATLSAEQQAAIVKQLRIGAITSLLTVQQQEYLSNIGLTTSSAGYEAAALSVLSAEQRLALSKMDLTAKSAAYRAAVIQEVQSKRASQAASLETMRTAEKEAAAKAEAARMDAIKAKSALEAAQMELHRAQTTAGVDAYLIAQKKLEAAQENVALTRKAALAAQSDFYAKKKQREAIASAQSRNASIADTAAKTANATATNILSAATGKLTAGLRVLWATFAANPLGAILSVLGLVFSLFTMFGNKAEETKDTMDEFNDSTKKVTDRLDLYYNILQRLDKDSKTYKDVLDKINQLCQEYNVTLQDENGILKEQKQLYDELKTAIQKTTAEKIIAKKTEEANTTLQEKNDENYDRFNDWVEDAVYWKATSEDGKSGYQTAATNIRNMSDDVKEATRAMVEEAAQELAKLEGAEFDNVLADKMGRITTAIQGAANISEAEMPRLRLMIDQSIKYGIRNFREYNDAIDAVTTRMNLFRDATETPTDTTSTDYAKMSFEDLDKLIQQTQKDIDAINNSTVNPGTDTTGVDALLSKLQQIKSALNTKTENLNTEEGISKRIKQLKEERAQTVINSARYKELNKEIAGLEARMPKHKTPNPDSANRNNETFRQKRIEAERRLQEARIAVMEEGFEKRKAMLELQHQQNLDRIDKEERELAEAKKKAGQGGLTASETQGFADRRTLA
ncbi:hypothetical protein, partial [Turicimonas muris]|uniref:hypothetical protein n=1 Tax=Turicimonas muris TaxID=1796652 RepID=UPI002609F0DC